MANTLQGRRIAILAADGVERVELETPRGAVQDAGGETELLSLKAGEIQARNNDLESAGTFVVDRVIADASVDDYDALLLPGGPSIPTRRESDFQSVTRRPTCVLQRDRRCIRPVASGRDGAVTFPSVPLAVVPGGLLEGRHLGPPGRRCEFIQWAK